MVRVSQEATEPALFTQGWPEGPDPCGKPSGVPMHTVRFVGTKWGVAFIPVLCLPFSKK